MRILVATMPAPGHVNPLRPIARELVRRGHHVLWWTAPAFSTAVAGSGAHFVPMRGVGAFGAGALDAAYPERAALTGLDQARWDLRRVFLDPIPEHVDELRRIVADHGVDLIVADTGVLAVRPLRELGGPPWVSVGVTPLALPSVDTAPFGTGLPPSRSALGRLRNRVGYLVQDRMVLRDVAAHYNGIRAGLGLAATRAPVMSTGFSSLLHLQAGVPELEYPRRDLPGYVHFVGALADRSSRDISPPPWWADVATATVPIVHVTQGTFADANLEDLVLPTLRALADADVLVVATLGRNDPVRLGVLPTNARVAPLLPYDQLLRRCAVMVTNGGFGGVLQALASGVPLVVAGATEDKPEVAARVAWSGAGVNLGTRCPTEAAVRAAVTAVLADDGSGESYRHHARRLRTALERHTAAATSADLIEQLESAHACR